MIQYKNNSAKLWSYLNSLIKSKGKAQIPIQPETLNDFFTSVFKQAPVPKNNNCHTVPNKSFVTNSFFLTPLCADEILTIMHSLSNSQAIGSDGLNPIYIKQNINLLLNPLLYIFNLSFTNGIFPSLLKGAIVTSVFKSGAANEPGKCRPISILTVFSKLLEKLFYNRLIVFINNQNVLHPHQFGFRVNHSTNLALAHVPSSLISKINTNNPVVLALLDLKKAFDLINHKLLIYKLNVYGIRGLPLKWLSNYLTDRFQKTKVNNIFSTNKPIYAGVPQGSILGPLLFILFINDVFQFNDVNVEIYLYADDTAIIFYANSDIMSQLVVDNFFEKNAKWCDSNCIIINPNKSNYLSFNANVDISVNGQLLLKVDVVKYLGVYIDDKLFWSCQVEHMFKLCCQRIGMFKKVLPFLPSHVILMYYNAFILSSFSYCIMFWFNNDRSGRYRLINKVNNLIMYVTNRIHCVNNTVFRNVYDVYKLQCLGFMYNLVNNNIYLPFFPCITNSLIHAHNTRTVSNFHINSLSTLDRRNFVYHSILHWNKTPIEHRTLSKTNFMVASKAIL